jgi:hypothetical protein
MVKATEALREGGGCLPFVRNMVLLSRQQVGKAVIARTSVVAGSPQVQCIYLLTDKSFLTGRCFRATYCPSPHFKSLVLGNKLIVWRRGQ